MSISPNVATQIVADDSDWQRVIVEDTSTLVRRQTWRQPDGSNEDQVIAALEEIRKFFHSKMEAFNRRSPAGVSMVPFVWRGEGADRKYWVFGFRAGRGARKLSLICHLDTVPPGSAEWRPFEPRQDNRIYKGVVTPFLIGRGAIDDKGPAVVAFEAFTRALTQAAPHPESLDKVTLEVLFDTSEETDMSTPHFFDANPSAKPALGIVFDAFWSVRAEKGIERPVFSLAAAESTPRSQAAGLLITSLSSSSGSANMIPVTAEARIAGPEESRRKLLENVDDWYRTCPFDGPDYHPADLASALAGAEVVITAKVAGAQHGSAPHQNRANGANPVVSLTNFLAFLIDRGILANNHHGEMCRFIRWAFGTRAFGEHQPDLLLRYDTVFGEGNGTTYALTQLSTDRLGGVSLGVDIRYALGHHAAGWDGREGELEGDSQFASVFTQLLDRYHQTEGGARLAFGTKTLLRPDIRSPRNAELFRINQAYRSVMGENCPMQAIGGATDAHGRLELVTAGSLFTDNLGPPVNYHGLDEGAPLPDLENSGKILLHLLLQELALPVRQLPATAGSHRAHGCCM